MNDQVKSFVDAYVAALREENAAVFAGAGMSIPAGLVDWAGLMREIAADVNLDVDKEHDLVTVAQYHVNERGGRARINQALVTEFADRAERTENHALLAALPIRTYWTTNYDTLLEDALRAAHKRPDIKTTEKNLATTLPRRDAVVYKIHGDVSQPADAVVTRDDYEAFDSTRKLFGTALQGDLVSKTFLFIGFSFSDPNLAYILSRIRVLLGQSRRDHYCLMRRVQAEGFESDGDFQYARARQELQVKDLRRYGIHVLLLDSYDAYTTILRAVTRAYRQTRAFVSGSAASYGNWTEADAQELFRLLGKGLIDAGFDVITGFGRGVGPFLLNGALQGLENDGTASIHDRITLRPFPQGIADPAERAARWKTYRKEMIDEAGIAVFLFGNRNSSNGEVELATGVAEEFELAQAGRLFVIPVASTGSMAHQLYDRVTENFDSYYPEHPELRAEFEALQELASPNTVADRIVKFITQLRRIR